MKYTFALFLVLIAQNVVFSASSCSPSPATNAANYLSCCFQNTPNPCVTGQPGAADTNCASSLAIYSACINSCGFSNTLAQYQTCAQACTSSNNSLSAYITAISTCVKAATS
ncbi:hypothetical protein ABPG74_009375 [Tetrahymena malaccensis]